MEWKRIALRAFSFGAGVGVVAMLAVTGLFLFRYHEETKPWTTPMKATFTGSTIRQPTGEVDVELDYAIENPTTKDYQIPFGSSVMVLLPDGNGYRTGEQAHVTLDNLPFIPSKQKVNVSISWALKSDDYTLPAKELANVVPFVSKRMMEIDGFSVFDHDNRIRIDFPNVWKDWPDIKKAQAEQKSKTH
jgi:hypothetical protein